MLVKRNLDGLRILGVLRTREEALIVHGMNLRSLVSSVMSIPEVRDALEPVIRKALAFVDREHIEKARNETSRETAAAAVGRIAAAMTPEEKAAFAQEIAVEAMGAQPLPFDVDPLESVDGWLYDCEVVSLHPFIGGWSLEIQGTPKKDEVTDTDDDKADGEAPESGRRGEVRVRVELTQKRVDMFMQLLASGPHFKPSERTKHMFFSPSCACSLDAPGHVCSACLSESKPGRFLVAGEHVEIGKVSGWHNELSVNRDMLLQLNYPADSSRPRYALDFIGDALLRLAHILPSTVDILERELALREKAEEHGWTPEQLRCEAENSFRFDLTSDVSDEETGDVLLPYFPPAPAGKLEPWEVEAARAEKSA
jgi:hypothetical protein